jgi:flagellar motor switch protein FliN
LSRSANVSDSESHDTPKVATPRAPAVESDPLDWVPRLSLRQVRLERRLAQWSPGGRPPFPLRLLEDEIGTPIELDRPEILWRASGLRRSNLVAQLAAPRLATRLALGIEIPLAHTVVDRLLGFDRLLGESRLQLSPVEWGVWTFVVLRALKAWERTAPRDRRDSASDRGFVGPKDLALDRVGPDPFDPAGLGSIVTIRWPARAGTVAGSVSLWLAESLLERWLTSSASPTAGTAADGTSAAEPDSGSKRRLPRGELSGAWYAQAAVVKLPHGLTRLRVGAVLPIAETRLTGSPRSPGGTVELVLDVTDGRNIRYRIPTCPVADSGGRLLRVEAGLVAEPRPRDPIAWTGNESKPMNPSAAAPDAAPPGAGPLDVPVTLIVELGRVNLTLDQLAGLKPGDVLELGRHSRAPLELTSNGRLVARGELVLLDAEMGVRVTNVFL